MIAETFIEATIRLRRRAICREVGVEILDDLHRVEILLIQRRTIDRALREPTTPVPELAVTG